jgi:hypothetical protein
MSMRPGAAAEDEDGAFEAGAGVVEDGSMQPSPTSL